jgi:hypothetical protein
MGYLFPAPGPEQGRSKEQKGTTNNQETTEGFHVRQAFNLKSEILNLQSRAVPPPGA